MLSSVVPVLFTKLTIRLAGPWTIYSHVFSIQSRLVGWLLNVPLNTL